MYNEITGNLISLAKEGNFQVIAHGCNCFCTMGAGIAPQMAKAFGCDKYPLEDKIYKGDIKKLGTIDYKKFLVSNISCIPFDDDYKGIITECKYSLTVVNAYTQYHYGYNHLDGTNKPFDKEAFTLCMRKMNSIFKKEHIGLPKIGAGLAGGDWVEIRKIIQKELKDCKITIVIWEKEIISKQ